MDQREIERIYRQSERFLTHHYPRSPKQALLDLADAYEARFRAQTEEAACASS